MNKNSASPSTGGNRVSGLSSERDPMVAQEPEQVVSRRDLIDLETLERVSPILRNVAHPLRLRVLDYLDREGDPRTVTEITAAAGGASQAIVSQQLRILKDQGVLTARREGNYIYYGIADRSVLLLLDCIRTHQQRRLNTNP
jgi:DNA-binding transcriptional ArsR family regulator